MSTTWIRVSKAHRCPVCDHADWCTFAPDNGLACCMRVESGKPARNGGYMHQLGDKTVLRPLPIKPEKIPTIDARAVMAGFSQDTWLGMQQDFAVSLGVSLDALNALGCCWARGYNAWAFPMKDWQGNTIGIRLRDHTGHKWAVRGSRAGLFYMEQGQGFFPLLEQPRTIYICEGPTDTAAGLSMGVATVGRPSCMGCEEETNNLLRRLKCREAVIVMDNDEPGHKGAVKLAAMLTVPCVIWCPPAKDLRQFYTSGGTKEMADRIIKTQVWRIPA